MKLKPLLVLSLVLNIALATAVGALIKRRAPSPPPASDAGPAPSTPARSVPQTAPSEAAPATPDAAPVRAIDWRMVESADYRKYIANLRAIGCPEETIRDIITADVSKLFDSRRKELNASKGKKFEFWKAGSPLGDFMDPAKIEGLQQLAREKRQLLKELLGVEPAETFDMFAGMNPFESMLDFLSGEKQNRVMEVYQDFQARMMKSVSSGTPDAEDMKSLQNAQKEMEAELAKILSPKEFEDYQLRMSQTSMMMRMQLSAFEPTEQEFRDIFKARKAFDDEYSVFGVATMDKEERQKREAAERTMKDAVKQTLGDARYTEYERSQDYAYQSMAKVAERQGLPKDAAVKVYDIKRLAEDSATKVRVGSSMPQERRAEALRGIRTETENAIKQVFGDQGWESYRKQQGAYWLNTLSPEQ